MADKILRLPQVQELTGLCRSAVYALKDFPRAVKIGGTRASGWFESDVQGWIDAQRNNRAEKVAE
jgi:predicted DNA-binding transcriptional regulator AlpA